MNRRVALGLLTGLIIAVAIFAVGCDGGGDDGDGVTPTPGPAAGTAMLQGQVVGADNPETLIANAVVTVEGTGRETVSASDGSFTIAGLPAGDWTVTVVTPQSAEYGSAKAQVPLVEDETSAVNFAVMPLKLAAPKQILLDPVDTTVDLNGRIAYRSQVVGPNNQPLEGIEPTWVVEGGIGQITPEGVFTALTTGDGAVRAFAGDVERTATVVVAPPRPPQITSFRVNPQSLPSSGGDVFMSAAIRDGDGVRVQEVSVRILQAGEEPIEIPLHVTNPGTAITCPGLPNCYVDASFGATYQVPPNDNEPTSGGVQAAERYSATLQVRDRSGMAAQSEFVEFVVQGINSPPGQPGI